MSTQRFRCSHFSGESYFCLRVMFSTTLNGTTFEPLGRIAGLGWKVLLCFLG